MIVRPQRIQLRRTKGWRMPGNTVSVARPTKWGNPYRVGCSYPTQEEEGGVDIGMTGPLTAADAVECFRDLLVGLDAGHDLRTDLPELRGKNLACWCPLDAPCHADVLLEIANA